MSAQVGRGEGLMFPDIRCPLCRSEAITTVVNGGWHLCQDCDHEWKEPAEAGSGAKRVG